MATIVDKAKEFDRNLKQVEKTLSFFKTEYLSIGKDGVIKISPFTHYLEDANIGVVFCLYNYLVQTSRDDSCFVQFVDDKGYSDDHYFMNGWIISINRPFTSSFRTYGCRLCIISNGEISIEVRLPVYGIAEKMKLLWPYFVKAQECKTQKELDLLKDCYEKDIDIANLRDTSLTSEHQRVLIEEQMNAYKAVLNKIEDIVNKLSNS